MDKEYYVKKILEQIKALTYGESMSELSRNIKNITMDWDGISKKDGKYYFYDYPRNHRRAEYGDEVKGEELNKYLALKEVYDDLLFNKVKAGVDKKIKL